MRLITCGRVRNEWKSRDFQKRMEIPRFQKRMEIPRFKRELYFCMVLFREMFKCWRETLVDWKSKWRIWRAAVSAWWRRTMPKLPRTIRVGPNEGKGELGGVFWGFMYLVSYHGWTPGFCVYRLDKLPDGTPPIFSVFAAALARCASPPRAQSTLQYK